MRKKITGIIRELQRCAKQNEADAEAPGGWDLSDCVQARVVAAEQRRMLRILYVLNRKK